MRDFYGDFLVMEHVEHPPFLYGRGGQTPSGCSKPEGFYGFFMLKACSGHQLENCWKKTHDLPQNNSPLENLEFWEKPFEGDLCFFLGIELYSKDLSSKFVWQSCKNSVLDSFR